MSDIDLKRLAEDREYWDRVAPEGAELYAPAEGILLPAFYKIDRDRGIRYCHLGIGDRWDESVIKRDLSGAIPRPPQKAQEVEWVDGLPPVGCECEYALKPSGPWFRCEIVSHNRMVIRCPHLETDSDNGLQIVGCNVVFRPLRTPEQSERDELIRAATKVIESDSVLTERDAAEALYDAGMLRKPEAD